MLKNLKIIFFLLFFYLPYLDGIPQIKKYVTKIFSKQEKSNFCREFDFNKNGSIKLNTDAQKITISGWKNKKIMLEGTKEGSLDQIKNSKIHCDCQNNIFTVSTESSVNIADINLQIIVPQEIENIIIENTGSVKIKNITSKLFISTKNGEIIINNCTKDIIAKSEKGDIKIKQKEFPEDSSIFIEVLNGNVTLQLPKNLNANFNGKTAYGKLTSQIPILLNSQTAILDKDYWEKVKKEASGTFGSSGAPITVDVNSGNITIVKA